MLALLFGCQRSFTAPKAVTHDPLAAVAEASTVAPWGTTRIDARGGKGSYHFTLIAQQSGPDASVSAAGLYRAGSLGGNKVDQVQVTDDDQGQVIISINISPTLRIAPEDTSVPVGGQLAFVASGGQPPYTFSLAAGGNTSWGGIQGSGVYTAGSNPEQHDVVQVVDANGYQVSASVAVGTAVFDRERTGVQVVRGDFNGDGVDDFLINDPLGGVVKLAVGGRGGPVVTQVLRAYATQVSVGDFDGDGCDDVLFSTGTGANQLLRGTPFGNLEPGPTFNVSFPAGSLLGGAPDLVPVDLKPTWPRTLLGVVNSGSLPSGVFGFRFSLFDLNDGGALADTELGRMPFSEIYAFEEASALPPFLPSVLAGSSAVMVANPPYAPAVLLRNFYTVDGGLVPGLAAQGPSTTFDTFPAEGALLDVDGDGRADRWGLAQLNGALESSLVMAPGLFDGGFGNVQVLASNVYFASEVPHVRLGLPAKLIGQDGSGGFQVLALALSAVVSPLGIPDGGDAVFGGDFNGDGQLDVIQRNPDGSLILFLADALGNYRTGRTYYGLAQSVAGVGGEYLAVGDLNGDGRADLLFSDDGLSFLAGTAEGRLSLDGRFATGERMLASAVLPGGALYASERRDGSTRLVYLSASGDAGWSEVEQPLDVPAVPDAVTPISAGGAVPGGDVLVHLGNDTPANVVLEDLDGGAGFQLDLLPQFLTGVAYPLHGARDDVDDLAYQAAPGNGSAAPIQIFAATGAHPPSWSSQPTTQLDGSTVGEPGVDAYLVGTLASRPNGPRDTVVLVTHTANLYAYSVGSGAVSKLATNNTLGEPYTRFSVGDFDRDGLNDVVALDARDGYLVFAHGTDAGFVTTSLAIPVAASQVIQFRAADVNGDGAADVVLYDADEGTLTVFLSRGDFDGNFHLE
ncbi:MAG: VCBS repeat-containing protein [Deltaproteobacteria bacterium]|nr:VCBS repeat-containing protein [Deltaproteobacteria bacterium]